MEKIVKFEAENFLNISFVKFEVENFEHLRSNTRVNYNYVGISPTKNGFLKFMK